MGSQAEAIASVITSVGGSVFVTQPTKAVGSQFSGLVDATILLDGNDPYSIVDNFVRTNDDLVTVTTTGTTLFSNLPFLNSLKDKKVVSHVQLQNFDYSVVTSLRDLGFPLLVSQTVQQAHDYARLAYSLVESGPVFHFFAPSNYGPGVYKDAGAPAPAGELSQLLQQYKIQPFEVVNKVSQPKDAVLFLGQLSQELVDAFSAENTVVVTVNVYKPFDLGQFLSQIPSSVTSLTLIEQSARAGGAVSPLMLDLFQDYAQQQTKHFSKIVTARAGFVAGDKWSATAGHIVANARAAAPVQNVTYGRVGIEVSTKAAAERAQESAQAVESAHKLEQAYMKLLEQANSSYGSRQIEVLNEFGAASAQDSRPDFGFGAFLAGREHHHQLVDQVYEAVQANSFDSVDSGRLVTLLSEWLVAAREDRVVARDALNELDSLLARDTSATAAALREHSDKFAARSSWLVGSDAWAYDLGASGVHNVITSGENINMLIIDSEPYQEKTGPQSHTYRKKDVGLYAMNYGGCYVASVAVYSSYTQVLQAFIEAEKFPGPAVVLAYLPYHSEHDDTLAVLKETKLAVDSGHWPLYRYDPTVEGEDAFKLDSSNLRSQLKDFLDRENRLTLLASRDPQLSRNLTATAVLDVARAQTRAADDSFARLLQGLLGPPVTVAFASDGGGAEGVAKKIHRQALGRGLKSVVMALDDVSIEDLPLETNIVFVTSTAGQGEMPNNGKAFWDGLKNSPDLDLSSVKYAVFGMGDSEYWPRKEDAHFYNKPGKDLFAKLKFYGAVPLVDLALGDDQAPDGFSTALGPFQDDLWAALGVAGVEGVEEPKPLTNEDMKIQSDFLRGTIVEGLNDQSTGAISAVDQQLTKFHGIYMQDDRDIRDERKAAGLEPAYAFMVRVRLPGGIATPRQYLKMDELADTRGSGTLKLTTRATFQLHGVVKHDLKPAIRGMNSALMDTLAACGDVNRNVMVSALPHNAKVHRQVSEVGSFISEFLLPQTTAYHEIWLQGEDAGDQPGDREVWETRKKGPKKSKTLVAGNALADVEPQYGATYLPRKFKIVITVPPYNDVDVYAHDVGLIAILEDDEVIGFNVLAGGGMGSTHNNKKTYPRTGSMLGYISRDQVHLACEKIMLVQRDFGDRTNRKHARLKYTMDDLGVDVFKGKVEELLGFKFEDPKPFEIKSNIDYFGWCKDENGLNHFTFFIENGRIEDTPELPQKTGLRKIAQYLDGGRSGEFRLTGNQHILVSNIEDQDLDHIKSLMSEYKLDNTDFSGLRLSSAACVAFPTCGLAMAESERYLPKLVTKLELALEEYGLRHDSVVMRMTGCPNGCARPWVAEVALVGKAYGAYNLMLGGGHHGERLNKIYRYSIKEDEILAILKPLFKRWSLERLDNEPFGDFCIRIGVIKPTIEGKYFHDDIPEEA